jgi:hypothetical protein
MSSFLKTLILAVFTLAVFAAGAAWAEKADGKVEWRNSSSEPKKSVVIREGGDTLIIRTDPRAADRIQRMLNKGNGRLIIRNRGFTYYPDNYYPYYRRRGAAYSVGRAVGTKAD